VPDDAKLAVRTAPVLAVLVCHNGEHWLPEVLESLRDQTTRPRHVLAVDTGSVDETPEILTEPLADEVLDGVITLDGGTGFAAALAIALNTAGQRWDDPGSWLWLLHDDCAPEPDCLENLIAAADAGRSVGVLGPLALDWTDPRLVVEGPLSTDAAGHRQSGLAPDELDWGRFAEGFGEGEVPEARRFGAPAEVLAVGSAGCLIRRELWESVGGYDVDLALFGDDVDFGWRTNDAGQAVLFVPAARVRHARAATRRLRDAQALGRVDTFGAARAHGVRSYLANCGRGAYLFGLPRLMLLCLLRAAGFALLRRFDETGTELRAFAYLVRGRGRLRAARKDRRKTRRGGTVSGLLTRRWTRLRNGLRRSAAWVQRRRIVRDSALGKLPATGSVTIPPEHELAQYVPAESAGLNGTRAAVGLRRASTSVVVALPEFTPVEPEDVGPPAVEVAEHEAAEDEAAEDEVPEGEAAEASEASEAAEVAEDAEDEDGDENAAPEVVEPEAAEAPAEAETETETEAETETESEVEAETAEPEAVEPEAAERTEVAAAPKPKRIKRPRWFPAVRPVHSDDPRTADADLMIVRLRRRRVLADILLAPPVLLVLALTVISLVTHADRLGTDLVGGRLLPADDLSGTWSSYLAAWQPVAGGSAAPAPAALAVLGILGAPFFLVGGPSTAIAVLLFGAAPLAGLFAYLVSRRLPVNRWVRAFAAAGYALLPPAVAAVGQGRLDAVMVHILLPLVLAGVVSVLTMRRSPEAGTAWLSGAVITSIGLAVLGAFSPLVHLLLLLVALAGFVVLPASPGAAKRRVASLFAIVLLPLALLLPWPAVVLGNPSVLLHGVGGYLPEGRGTPFDLASLVPAGPATLPYVGLALVLVAVLAAVLRRRSAVLPGVGIVLLGAAATAAVFELPMRPIAGLGPEYGWAGTPLIVVGAGLLWMVLGAFEAGSGGSRLILRAVGGLGVLTVLAFAVGTLVAGGQGPLRAGGGMRLAADQEASLGMRHSSVLVLAAGGEPVRQSMDRTPRFGDDDVPRVAGAQSMLAKWDLDLRSTNPDVARPAIASAATSGVRYLVLPDLTTARELSFTAGELLTPAPPATDGRPVEQVVASGGSATLTAPEISRLAVGGQSPPAQVNAPGVVPVDAAPPDVAVRVSPGPPGRLLVLGANDEPSWQAEIDGKPAPTTRVWGHQVSVAVPKQGAEVRVYSPRLLRDVLLLAQLAAALFALFTALPGRRRPL
jgi:GT2 family glycosyltransferase